MRGQAAFPLSEVFPSPQRGLKAASRTGASQRAIAHCHGTYSTYSTPAALPLPLPLPRAPPRSPQGKGSPGTEWGTT